MIEIVIPMAGEGSRFKNAGFSLPKPFIDVSGKMMIERVLDGVKVNDARYTLVIQERFLVENLSQIKKINDEYNVQFVNVEKLTQGASCTALAARKFINLSNLVVFVDSDNIFDNKGFNNFIIDAQMRNLDGSLLTFKSNDNKFSFAKIDDEGYLIQTKEKEVISNHAIAGAYLFKNGEFFVDCVIDSLIYGDKVKNEYYMSNVYNYAIKKGLKIGIFDIPDNDFNCVGTPLQLQEYINLCC